PPTPPLGARVRRLVPPAVVALASAAVHGDDVTVVTPPCPHAAPLRNQYDGAPGYFVTFKDGVSDPRATAAALAKKYHFNYQQYSWGSLFIRSISPVTLAELRCDPRVESVEFNVTTHASEPTARAPNNRRRGP